MRILILGRPTDERAEVLRAVTQQVTHAITRQGATLVDEQEQESPDAVIVLGGDGLLIHAADRFGEDHTPILGINVGHLGFLSATEHEQATRAVQRLVAGDYRIEERLMLSVSVRRPDAKPVEELAINEVVVKSLTRVTTLRVEVDGNHLIDYRGDGGLVGTPTGSTAYNRAAGGPIVEPSVECLLFTAICPHPSAIPTLVLPGHSVIALHVGRGEETTFAADGRERLALPIGSAVTVRRARQRAHLVRFPETNFLSVLRDKLQLEERARRFL